MSSINTIQINTALSAAQFSSLINPSATDPKGTLQRMVNYFKGLFSGAYANGATIYLKVGEVAATATLTSTGAATAAQTFVLNGVTFTGRASGAVADEFNVSATPATQATNIAAAINASVTAGIPGVVTAAASSGVVTITAVEPGIEGNSLIITEGLSNVTLSSFATSATGANGTEYTLSL